MKKKKQIIIISFSHNINKQIEILSNSKIILTTENRSQINKLCSNIISFKHLQFKPS